MAEPSVESLSNELDGGITLRHGAFEINFPAKNDPYVSKRSPYRCKSLLSGNETDLSPSEMSLVMSIDTDKPKTRAEISKDFNTWLTGAYSDFGIKRQITELSHSSFGVLMHKVQTKLGYGAIEYVSPLKYKMAEYPKKK